MSFILNALRKSEEERQSAPSNSSIDRIQDKEDETKKKKPLWIIILSLANICLLAYFVWFFMLKNEPETSLEVSKEKPQSIVEKPKKIAETTETVSKPLVVAESKPKKNIAPVVREIIQPKEQVVPREEVKPKKILKHENELTIEAAMAENTKTRKQEQQISIAQRIENRRLVKAEKKQVVVPQPKKIDNQRIIKKNKSPFSNRTKKQPPVEETPSYFEKSERGKNNPPYLSGLSYDFRRTVPKVRINVFVYSEAEEDRMVMIDMKKYRAGEDIAENMELKEIRQNSIVVEYKGEVFQIKR